MKINIIKGLTSKRYNHPPKVLAAKDGIVTMIQRHYDKQIIEVGMEIWEGAKLLTLNWDTSFAGDMSAEIGKKGCFTSISAISIRN